MVTTFLACDVAKRVSSSVYSRLRQADLLLSGIGKWVTQSGNRVRQSASSPLDVVLLLLGPGSSGEGVYIRGAAVRFSYPRFSSTPSTVICFRGPGGPCCPTFSRYRPALRLRRSQHLYLHLPSAYSHLASILPTWSLIQLASRCWRFSPLSRQCESRPSRHLCNPLRCRSVSATSRRKSRLQLVTPTRTNE